MNQGSSVCNGTWVLLGPTGGGGGLWSGVRCHWMSLSPYGTLCAGRMAGDGDGSPPLNVLRVVGWYHAAGWRAAVCTAHPSRLSQGKIIFVLPVVMLFDL